MLDNTAVEQFYNYYHAKKITNPDLYVSNDSLITVVLPKALLDYANAAAGHSGFGAGARPVGIRRSVDNARAALADIFASVESLTQFILSSECNAEEYILQIREKHYQQQLGIDNRMAEDRWKDLFAKYDMQDLAARFGRDSVLTARRLLTVNEFELRFGL